MASPTIEIWAPMAASSLATTRFTTALPTANALAPAAPARSTLPRTAAAVRTPRSIVQKVFGDFTASQVDLSELTDNLKETLAGFQQMMADMPETGAGYHIDQIELNLGVNGKGGVVLIGKMEVGLEAAIKVTIKRGN